MYPDLMYNNILLYIHIIQIPYSHKLFEVKWQYQGFRQMRWHKMGRDDKLCSIQTFLIWLWSFEWQVPLSEVVRRTLGIFGLQTKMS